MTRFLPVALLGVALALSACTTRMQIDFEDDTLGALPDQRPSGLPNDRVRVQDPGTAVFVTDDPAIDGEQSLRIGGSPSGGATLQPQVLLVGEPLRFTDRTITIAWKGLLSSKDQALVTVEDLDGTRFVTVSFNLGSVFVNGEAAGRYAYDEPHQVLLVLDPQEKSYSFLSSGTRNAARTGTLFEPDSFPARRLSLRITAPNVNATRNYIVDTVRMFERNPPT